MSFWNTLRIGSSGLTAQRLRLDVISNNIANSATTSTGEGEGAYQRQDVVFQTEGEPVFFPSLIKTHDRLVGSKAKSSIRPGGVKVSEVVTDESEGPVVFDPNHPHANEDGYVEYPNVNLVFEMTNMLSATRSYEANLNLISAAKRMAQKAIEIGR